MNLSGQMMRTIVVDDNKRCDDKNVDVAGAEEEEEAKQSQREYQTEKAGRRFLIA